MYTYQVLQECFVDGVLRKPGDDRHGIFARADKIDPLPDHLKEVNPEKPEVAEKRKVVADTLKKNVKKQQEEVKGASFMDGPKSGGVEIL